MNICKSFVVVVFAVLSIVGCKPGIPDKYLQPDEMADILYDYHLAEGIANGSMQDTRDTIALRTFRASILRKHGVSQADFDSSLVYYTRHTKLLEDIYTKLVDRFNSESVALGGASMQFGDDIASSDTTNIWGQASSFVLTPFAAANRLTFNLQADSSFYAGDRFMLDFDAAFIYQDGMRDASVVLAVTYANDSTEYVNNSVMSSSHFHLQIDNSGRLPIKSVRGFWLLSSDRSMPSSSQTTLKLLVVSNVKLIRMHTKPIEDSGQNNGETADSTKSSKDSMVVGQQRQMSTFPRKPMSGQPLRRVSDQSIKPLSDKSLTPISEKPQRALKLKPTR